MKDAQEVDLRKINFEELLRDNEIIEKDGKKLVLIGGLRRLAHEYGLVVETKADVQVLALARPNGAQVPYAVVTYTIIDIDNYSFVGTGDAWADNMNDTVALYPAAVAETRAESRALKRLLRINLLCESEISDKTYEESHILSSSARLDDTFIVLIKRLAKKLGINDEKELVNLVSERDIKELNELNDDEGRALIGVLNGKLPKNK